MVWAILPHVGCCSLCLPNTFRVYAVVLSHGMLLPAPFPFLIKLMNSGRHVRERHTKTKDWFTLLECCLFHQDKGKALHSLSWAGLDNCLPKRLKSEYVCSSFYNIPPLPSFSQFILSTSTWNNQCRTFPFPAILPFSESTLHPILTSLNCRHPHTSAH